jgi:hypothetical protein
MGNAKGWGVSPAQLRFLRRYLFVCGSAALLGFVVSAAIEAQPADVTQPVASASCATVAAPTAVSGVALDSTTPTRDGVVFDTTTEQLRLERSAGNFQSSNLAVSDTFVLACEGDFDEDGWTDFIGASKGTDAYVNVYKNRTFENPPPANWDDPSLVRQPKFVAARITSTSYGAFVYVVCGDFNGDRHQDFGLVEDHSGACPPGATSGWDAAPCADGVKSASMYLGRGDGTFATPYSFLSTLGTLSYSVWGGRNAVAHDYNKDGHLDMIIGLADLSASGKVIALLNNGAAQPSLDNSVTLVADAQLGTWGASAIAVADATGDGIDDLVAGGVSTQELRLYPGLLGGGFDPTYQPIPWSGAAAVILAGDFSQSGRQDLVVGSDNWNYPGSEHAGGNGLYYRNNGTAQPFSSGATTQLSSHQDPHDAGALFDYDAGLALDYDHDPQRTTDFMMVDGNHSGTFFVFANRPQPSGFVKCGFVTSSTLDIGALAAEEITISQVELVPSVVIESGTTLEWQSSVDGGRTWVDATACPNDATHYCASFDRAVGREIQWRAKLCADATQSRTPSISSVATSFAYLKSRVHMRAGPVASEGLIYVGAFSEPGDQGHFYAINDQTAEILWDSGPLLTSTPDGARHVYTAASTGQRLDFATASATDDLFRDTILSPDPAQAAALVSWQRSTRFGLRATARLGGIESSTAAVMTPPKEPYWYAYPSTTGAERSAIDSFVATHAARPRLVYVGAKDGALHAFHSDPTRLGDAKNGTEAWAFIPYDVAQRLAGDMASGGSITAYPDGSPTLVDAKVNDQWRTVLVSGEGNGGTSVFALDVTDTIAADGTISGPKPLWSVSDARMGQTLSKPSVVRVKDASGERWLAIFASGRGATAAAGHSVYAVDLSTGALVWTFDTGDDGSFVTTDVTAVETDDPEEPGSPTVDGYTDLVFFGDSRGRVWKLDPSAGAGGTLSPSAPGLDVGLAAKPLFATRSTSGALGVERAILGTVAVAQNRERHLVLYFGTGTPDDNDPTEQNAFYSVYSYNGRIRMSLDASSQLGAGMKFSGGVVINDGQVIFGVGRDLAGPTLCAPSEGAIVGIDIDSFAPQFTIQTASKIVSPIYIRNGQYYTANFGGQIQTSEYTGGSATGGGGLAATATTTSGGTATSPTSAPLPTGSTGTMPNPFNILSWTQRN